MGAHPFSPAGRAAALAAMAREPVDLLVIGGGITGCGLARDAALRGLRTALVEKEDFGYGTSSRSSKMIHSGIRYLLYGHVGLVREAARERAVLRAIAPHLVRPLPFLIPLHGDDPLAGLLRRGFRLVDWLTGARGEERHRLLAPEEVRRRAPGLREPLLGGVLYGEYLTDDARLTLENALSAALHGAYVANHAAAVGLLWEGGRVVGARVRDALSGRTFEVRARVVVNATGPWAQRALQAWGLRPPRPLLPSKGVHLAFDARRLPLEGAVALRSPSGRQGFAIRRGDRVYVGTTDVAYHGDLDGPVADREACEDLLALVRDCFPGLGLGERDVLVTWAGVRPLVAEPGRKPRDTSRRDEVWPGPPGLLTVAGGKLTTYRAMADRILRHVARALGRDPGEGRRAATVPLPGGDLGSQDFAAFRAEAVAELTGRGVPAAAAERLTWLYGARVRALLRLADEDPAWLRPLAPGVPAVRGEVRLAVEEEMALTLADFLDRRSSLLLFGPDRGLPAAEEAARIMGEVLGWDEAERQGQLERYRALARAHGMPGPADGREAGRAAGG